ncbi:MAG: DUF2171 domain-containing protein [Chloroflexi bacterium]|nr:DUF2171 domain-containing protein [Chloroflexota bacterium]
MNDLSALPAAKLLVSSLVKLEQKNEPVELRRGMAILLQDGYAAGTVAALALDRYRHEVTHILLGHVPPTSDYHLIPLPLIERLEGETVYLRASAADIEKLPTHQSN